MSIPTKEKDPRTERVERHLKMFRDVLERNHCDELDKLNVGLSLVAEVKALAGEIGPDSLNEINQIVVRRLL